MTMTIPESVKAKGNVRPVFVPSIADLNDPSVAEAIAGLHFGCYLLPGWEGATSTQESETDSRFCSAEDFERPGIASHAIGELNYTYDPQGTLTDTAANTAYETLAEGTRGFVLIRYGKPSSDAIVAGDVVDIFPVECGVQNKRATGESASSPLTVSQRLFVVGTPVRDAVVAA